MYGRGCYLLIKVPIIRTLVNVKICLDIDSIWAPLDHVTLYKAPSTFMHLVGR